MNDTEVNNQDENLKQDETIVSPTLEETAQDQSENEEVKANEKTEELVLNNDGHIIWNEVPIAKLLPNQPLFSPKFELIGEELNREETMNVVSERLYSWLDEQIRSELYPLTRLKNAIEFVAPIVEEVIVETDNEEIPAQQTEAENIEAKEETSPIKPKAKLPLSDAAKALAIKIHAANGILDRNEAEAEIQALSQDCRRELRQIGVKFGRAAVYLPLLLKPRASRLNAILTHFSKGNIDEVKVPRMGVTSFNVDENSPNVDYSLSGFKNIGGRIIRLDILDRVIDNLFEAAKEAKGPIAMPISVVSLLGVSNEVACNVVAGLGWEKQSDEEGVVKWSLPRKKPNYRPVKKEFTKSDKPSDKKFNPSNRPAQKEGFRKRKDKDIKPKRRNDFVSNEAKSNLDSPFAILAQLKADLNKSKD